MKKRFLSESSFRSISRVVIKRSFCGVVGVGARAPLAGGESFGEGKQLLLWCMTVLD